MPNQYTELLLYFSILLFFRREGARRRVALNNRVSAFSWFSLDPHDLRGRLKPKVWFAPPVKLNDTFVYLSLPVDDTSVNED